MKINNDVIYINNKLENLKHFIYEGNIFSHLIDRIKWYWYPQLKIVSNFPTHVDIEITNACQLKCPMCAQNVSKTKKGFMDFEVYKKIIDECAKKNMYSIRLSWRGEVALHKNLFKMLEYAKYKKIKSISFLTNLERLNKMDLEKLVDLDLTYMVISFDGMKETYEKIRYPAKFEESVDKIKHLYKYKKAKNKYRPLIRLNTISYAVKDNLEEFNSFFKPFVDKIMVIADQERYVEDDTRKFIKDPDYVCQYPWQRAVITYNGDIVQCIDDEEEINIIGSVKNKTIKQMWHSEKMNILRKFQKEKKLDKLKVCKNCLNRGKIIKDKKNKKVKYKDQKIEM